jgi:hypothetical protein
MALKAARNCSAFVIIVESALGSDLAEEVFQRVLANLQHIVQLIKVVLFLAPAIAGELQGGHATVGCGPPLSGIMYSHN